MPSTGVRKETEMTTRNNMTRVKVELGLRVDGRELPNAEVLGKAMEAAFDIVEQTIKDSYKAVPPRVDTPMLNPFDKVAGT